jgi:hypothetical protein
MSKRKISPWSYLEPIYFVIYFIIAIIVGIICYPFMLFAQPKPHHEESGYDV